MGIFDKFKSGFKKSASTFTTGLRDIVIKKEIDDKTLDRIEEYLIQSDVGIIAAAEIKEIISDSKIDPKKDITEEITIILKEYIISLISDAATTPTSDWIKYSSILSKVLSSISFLTTISLNPLVKAEALFLKPDLNLSKIPIKN